MGSLCSRLKVRFARGSNSSQYNPLRSETPTSGDSGDEMLEQSVWVEAGERVLVGESDSMLTKEDDDALSEIQFDTIAAQVKHLYQPIEFLQKAVTNSLLLFKFSLGLSKTSSIEECFQQLQKAAGSSSSSSSIEIMKTADGPRKLSVSAELWKTLPDDVQSAITHFNSMLNSSHKYLGSQELKLTDIRLKLDDMKLLPKTCTKESEYKDLKGIIKSISDFSNEINSLFYQINIASGIFEHQITIDS